MIPFLTVPILVSLASFQIELKTRIILIIPFLTAILLTR